MVTTKWVASLSDGTTAVEGEGLFSRGGGTTMWQKLLDHVAANDLSITGFRIQVMKDDEPTKTYNLPSCNIDKKSGKHEKWPYLYPLTPATYDCRRVLSRALNRGSTARQTEAIAKFKDFSISLFIDQDTGNEAWVVVHELK